MRLTCKTLIADSRRAGFKVVESAGRTRIDSPKLSIMVYPDGAIHRADVRLDLAIRMRVKDAYSVLGFELNTETE
jgi:hypothetical protein